MDTNHINATFPSAVKHVPRLLRHQILSKLSADYVADCDGEPEFQSGTHTSERSMRRFYASLLFVDISGFTALSQKLDVESLKNHINDYFAKMLSVIDKWGGDVVKFAGDALYIVWEVQYTGGMENDVTVSPDNRSKDLKTACNLMSDQKFLAAAKSSVEKAVACALEINACCCNHKVILTEPSDSAQSRWSKLFNSLPVILGQQTPTRSPPNKKKVAPSPSSAGGATASFTAGSGGANNNSNNNSSFNAEKVAYLNVHSGVGFGLLAGVDVGCRDRWEFFLLGEPINQVAGAEGLAGTGDVVVSSIAHGLIHHVDESLSPPPPAGSGKDHILNCGCCRLPFDFYRTSNINVSTAPIKHVNTRRSKSKSKFDEHALNQAVLTNEGRIVLVHSEEVEKLFLLIQSRIKKLIYDFWTTNKVDLRPYLPSLPGTEDDHKPIYYPDETKTFTRKIDKVLIEFLGARVKPAFCEWINKCLVDDLVRHTHEAARARMDLFNLPRHANLHVLLKEHFIDGVGEEGWNSSFIDEMKLSHSKQVVALTALHENDDSSIKNSNELDELVETTVVKKPTTSHSRRSNASNSTTSLNITTNKLSFSQKNLLQDAATSAEMRTVTVMFVKIDGLDSLVYIDDDPAANEHDEYYACYSKFGFLRRSVSEMEADTALLDRLQQCMNILCNAFSDNGGQMRQFIIDDKGTVCIGSFGLRGSMAVDNAAAAIETARTIVISLQSLGLTASIGITSGKVYCGIVGSQMRHEYAVMGPSVNLSARLMCKAPPCSVMTDTDTKSKDRTHSFETLNEITAKGYTLPVMTFKPLFEDLLRLQKSVSIPGEILASMSNDGLDWRISSRKHNMMIRASIDINDSYGNNSMKLLLPFGGGSNSNLNSRRNSLNPTASNPFKGSNPSTMFKSVLLQSDFTVHRKRGSRDFVALKTIISNSISESDHPVDSNHKPSSAATVAASNVKLYGRDREISSVLDFLFAPLCENSSTLLQAYHNVSTKHHFSMSRAKEEDGQKKQPIFLFQEPSRMIVIHGQEGLGKSTLVNSIARKFVNMTRQEPHEWNLVVFKNKSNSLHSNAPFHSWIVIVQDLLIKVHRTHGAHGSGGGEGGVHTTTSSNGNSSKSQRSYESQLRSGLQYLLPLLPVELQALVPLLSELSICKVDESEKKMTFELPPSSPGRHRFLGAVDLLAGIFQLFPSLINRLCLIILEKLDLFDNWSLLLLHRLWKQITGIAILATCSPFEGNNSYSPQHNKDDGTITSGDSDGMIVLINRKNMSAIDQFFIKYILDPMRFQRLDLKVLEKEAIISLSRDAFMSANDSVISNHFLDKVYEISGGNPLYAYELVNSMQSCSLTADATANLEQLFSSASNRIEEVICYRFDQLDHATQAMLKTASVICANNSVFTFDMLVAVMLTRQQTQEIFMSDSALIHTLNALILREEFLQIVYEDHSNNREESSSNEQEDSFDVDFDTLRSCKLSFRVVLEQLTIYNLLVDAQKESIHDQVATYYHQQALLYEPNVTNLLEEAFHWQRASLWAYALGCYYRAASKLWELGDYKGYKEKLQFAFKVYHSLRKDVGIAQPAELTLDSLSSLFAKNSVISVPSSPHQKISPRSTNNANASNNNATGNHNSSEDTSAMSYESIHEMCYSETETLLSILNMHISMAQYHLLTMESPLHTMLILEEALLLLYTSRSEPDDNVSHNSNSNMHSHGKSRHNSLFEMPRSASIIGRQASVRHAMLLSSNQSVTSKQGPGRNSFRLPGYHAISHSIFSACIHIHTWSPTSTAPRLKKAELLCEMFLHHTEHESEDENHIQALAQAICISCRDGYITQAVAYAEVLQPRYKVKIHSLPLQVTYGLDLTHFALSLLAQQLLLKGEIITAMNLMNHVTDDIMKYIHHGYSINMTFIPLSASLIFLHRHDEAAVILDHVHEIDNETYSVSLIPSEFKTDLQSILLTQIKLSNGLKPSSLSQERHQATDHRVLPQAVHIDEEYAPRRTSFLGHFLHVNGLAAEALKLELTLLQQLRSMTTTPEEIMNSFTKYYLQLAKARSPHFDAFVMSELWPLVTLLSIFRGKHNKHESPRLPADLLRAILELMKRCERYKYYLASAVLGELLAELNVPRKLKAAGQHLRDKAFEAIDKQGDSDKLRRFMDTFKQIIRAGVGSNPTTTRSPTPMSVAE